MVLLSPRNFIERLVILEEEGGAGSFNNVISPKDLEFLRRIGNKLMQLSLDRGGSRVDERSGVNQLLLLPSSFPFEFFLFFFLVATQSSANDFAFSSTHCRHSTLGEEF